MALTSVRIGTKEVVASGSLVFHTQSVTIKFDTSSLAGETTFSKEGRGEVEFKFVDDSSKGQKIEAKTHDSKLVVSVYNLSSSLGGASTEPMLIGKVKDEQNLANIKYVFLNIWSAKNGPVRQLTYTIFVSDTENLD